MKKIYPLSRLAPIVEKLKKEGKRIVLANGCFDLIHVGHIRYLRESKEQGDILVVALNSDASVQQLKGKGRPLMGENERAEILSAFSFVDYLTFFDEQKVDEVLVALRPDVHAKGSDYGVDTVPEKDTALRIGTEIAITGGPKVRSTSDLIAEIAKSEGSEEER